MRPSHLSAIFLSLCVAAPVLAQQGRVSGKVRVLRDGKAKDDLSNVVVYLEGAGRGARPKAPPREIRQRELQFSPQVTVVVVGESVDFPNDDRVFHNVFSVSEPARFDLGLYKEGTRKTVTFTRPGTVDIYCNIHPQMVAKVKVVDTWLHSVTGPDGTFRIDGVPKGTYTLVAWQPFGPELRSTVTVEPGKDAAVQLELAEGTKPKWHLRKDGTPYGRYK